MAIVGGKVGGSNWQHGTHGATSSLTDFSSHMVSVDFKSNGEKLPADTWGNGTHIYENGFKSLDITAVYQCNDTVEGQLWDIHLNDDVVDFQLGPNGTSNGKLKFTGTAQIFDISAPIVVNQVEQITVQFSMAGAVTKGTFS